MKWGNPEASDSGDSRAVFDAAAGFLGVWHLGEPGSTTAGGYKDATASAADLTGVNLDGATPVDGRVGKALALSHDKTQWLRLDPPEKNKLYDIYEKMTYSIWLYTKSHTVEYQAIFTKGETGFRMHYYGMPDWTENRGRHIVEICVEEMGGGDICPLKGGNANAWQGTDVAPGKWVHWVAVHDHPRVSFYLNGVLEVTQSPGGAWTSGAAQPVGIGNNTRWPDGRRSFDGTLDEARVMNVVKDATWAKLEYESQREGSKLVSFGEIR
jgi:hypothetical protein